MYPNCIVRVYIECILYIEIAQVQQLVRSRNYIMREASFFFENDQSIGSRWIDRTILYIFIADTRVIN